MVKGTTKQTLLISTLLVVAILGGAYGLIRNQFPQYFAETGIYSVAYSKPKGWTEHRPGPFTLFVFRHPEGRGTLSASINEIHANFNPTPELDTNGIANYYVDITRKNMPGWKAERLAGISAGPENFSVIRREQSAKTVYTAFLAKGNTTVVVSLSSYGKQARGIEDLVPEFKKLVASFKLSPKPMDLEE